MRGARSALLASTGGVGAWLAVRLLVATAAMASALVTAPAAVSATGCGALVVTPRPGVQPPTLVITVPSSLSVEPLTEDAVSVAQRGLAVPVRSMRPQTSSETDLAVVLDTASDVPDRVFRRALRVMTALLESLPTTVRVALVSGGGVAEILSPLSTDRDLPEEALRDAARQPGHAWLDGIALATETLPEDPDRYPAIALVTTGPDDASERGRAEVQALVAARQISLVVTAVGDQAALSVQGDRCPPGVDVGQEEVAGELVARRVAGRQVVVVPTVDFATPFTVRVRSGAVDVSAAVAASRVAGSAADTAATGTTDGRPPGGIPGGIWTMVGLGLVAGALLVGVVSVPVLRSAGSRGAHVPSHTRPTTRAGGSDEEMRLDARAARLGLLALLPVAIATRTVFGSPSDDDWPWWPLLAAAALLAGFGTWWLWRATAPPYPLWPYRGNPHGDPPHQPRGYPWGPRVSAVAPFCLCLLPALLLILLS